MATQLDHTPRSLRALAGLTKEALAAQACVSRRTIDALESGEDVTLDTLRRVAAALDVQIDILVAAHDVQRQRGAA